MEERFRDKNREIDQHEKILKKVEEVVAAAINSVSRFSFQLYDDFEKKKIAKTDLWGISEAAVNPSNVEAHLSVCGMKLERMLSELKVKKVVFYEESVNTNKESDQPPYYINLNKALFGGFNRDVRDETEPNDEHEEIEEKRAHIKQRKVKRII
jgi:hypothetical protein